MMIPAPIIERITHRPMQINNIIMMAEQQRDGQSNAGKGTPFFGFQLPSFQRGMVWVPEQNERFIESAYMGFDLGSYVVNDVLSTITKQDVIEQCDMMLIDGQQRINAIRGYVNNEFKVFGYFWKELESVDQRRFRRVLFTRGEITCTDEVVLRDLYNRLNYGGTPHTPEERA